jgi:DNA phosphorothioation system restriction enzyme
MIYSKSLIFRMGFLNLELPTSIRTTHVDPIKNFFDPVLGHACSYDVAVGYFTTAWIRDAAEGVAQFACNGGHARWIVSPILSKEDYELLRSNEEHLEGNVDNMVSSSFQNLFDALQSDTRTVIAWLIYDEILEFRIGVLANDLTGDLHAKMGVFTDEDGNKIGFSGSYNLTGRASSNWERIDIFPNWRNEDLNQRVEEISSDIDDMWLGNDNNLLIFEPSERALSPFIQEAKRTKRPYKKKSINNVGPSIPGEYLTDGRLRPYQEDAMDLWFKNNGRGIFNMATGSGKTATALALVTKLSTYFSDQDASLVCVVTVPFKHLADQWETEAANFGFSPVICYGSVAKWMPTAQDGMRRLAMGEAKFLLFIVVNATFCGDPFQGVIDQMSSNFCFIADEMHNLGAENTRRLLPTSASFRLGLSATPVRHRDDEGTSALQEYFGEEVITFKLSDAIQAGYLCPYRYFPVPVTLTDEEMETYTELSFAIARASQFGGSDSGDPNETLKLLLIKRARLISGAKNKLVELVKIIKEDSESTHNLIYCGAVSDDESGERHVEEALRLIGTEVGMRANKFTHSESPSERRVLLERFSSGEIQALVAIRCLDEGVDVPRTETAYILASSSNPRQFIQRRGRVLRRAPGKEYATIYDFVVIPDIEKIRNSDAKVFNIERKLVKSELARVEEFVDMADNRGHSLKVLRSIRKRLNLLDS